MNLMYFIFFNLVIYLPFHLFEEAVGDFPKWMYEHKWLPYHMTHGHWMANNLFIYYPMLIVSVFLFVFINQFVCFGVAILIWGIINFGDHFFYTIKDRKISPGLITFSCQFNLRIKKLLFFRFLFCISVNHRNFDWWCIIWFAYGIMCCFI